MKHFPAHPLNTRNDTTWSLEITKTTQSQAMSRRAKKAKMFNCITGITSPSDVKSTTSALDIVDHLPFASPAATAASCASSSASCCCSCCATAANVLRRPCDGRDARGCWDSSVGCPVPRRVRGSSMAWPSSMAEEFQGTREDDG